MMGHLLFAPSSIVIDDVVHANLLLLVGLRFGQSLGGERALTDERPAEDVILIMLFYLYIICFYILQYQFKLA